MARGKVKQELTLEEKLERALVPSEEHPYEIPPNWYWTQIKQGFNVTSSKRVHKSDWVEVGIPFYRTRELVKLCNDGYVNNELFITEELYNELAKNYGVPQINDVLVSGVGTIGVPYVVSDESKFYFKDGNVIWYKNKGLFNAQYIYWLYNSMFIYNQIHDMSAGTTVDTYTIVNAEKTLVPLPSLAEQQRIVDRIESLFTKLGEVKEKLEAIQDNYDTRRASVLHKAFSGELTKQWRDEHLDYSAITYLDNIAKQDTAISRLDFNYWINPTLPKGWAESKIGNCLYYAGRIGWKGLKAEEYTDDGPLFLSVYNLNDGDEVSYKKVYHISDERYEESPEIMVQIGDILLTKDGAGIGKLGYVKDLPREATINSSLLLIRPGAVALPKFIFYLLSGPALQNIVKERITGSATPHLFQRDIKEFVIPLPPIEEQKVIVEKLDSILSAYNSTKENLTILISKIDLIKKSILARAFRGELGTNNPEEESSIELLKQILTEK